MRTPIIVDNGGNIPAKYQGWSKLDTFNSENREVTLKGRRYVIIEKREKEYSVGQRIGRVILGALAVVGTAFIGLASKDIRKLFTAKIQTERFAQLVQEDPNNFGAANSLSAAEEYWRNSSKHFKISSDYYGNPIQYVITISRRLVQDNPERTLEEFYKRCFIPGITANNIRIELLQDDLAKDDYSGGYKRDEAADVGGITREIISVLFTSLSQGALKNKDKLKFNGGAGGSLPDANTDPLSNDEAHLYEAMGKLMGMCFTSGVGVIGNIFSPELYDVLEVILNRNKEDQIMLYQILKNNEPEDLAHLLNVDKDADDATIQRMFYSAYPDADFDEEGLPDVFKNDRSTKNILENLDLVKDSIRTQVLNFAEPAITPILEIARGMRAHRPHENWGNANNIMDKVQGIFSKEILLNSLSVYSPHENNPRVKDWIKQWIKEKSVEEVQQFVRAATGSDTLGIGKKINIHINASSHASKNGFPEYHTCFMQANFPRYDNYKIFKEKFEESILNALQAGFGVV